MTNVEESANVHKRLIQHSFEDLSPKSKYFKFDDTCKDPDNNPIEDELKNKKRWSYNADVSLVEPEVLMDLGVSMLEDTTSSESLPKLQSQVTNNLANESEYNVCLSITNSAKAAKNSINRNPYVESSNRSEEEEEEAFCKEALELYHNGNNESGYNSRLENGIDRFDSSKSDSMTSDSRDKDQFYLYRRKKRYSFTGEDKFNRLSDEIILMILKWLPKKWLVQSMLVCKRWNEIARDEALWGRLDLGSKVLNAGTLGHILPRGVQILRLAQAEISDPVFTSDTYYLTENYKSKLQYLDLSMAVISPESLAKILFTCTLLKKLSLERGNLNEDCCKAISQNVNITVLNLTMCEGIDSSCVKYLMKLEKLQALNISWCSLDSESVSLVCSSLPYSITRLNISGYRKTITDDDVKILVMSCPNLIELDLSDCTLLTMNSIQSILNLKKLEHLSISRCYSIPPSTYLRLAYMQSLMFLDVFSLMEEPMLKSLKANSNGTEINKFLYSSVARPTVGVRRTSIWGLRVRD